MEIATVVFLAVWLTVFCIVAYRQLKKEFKFYLDERDEKNK